MTWTHKFVCLADSAQDDVPGAADKHKLKCADLGEKKIVFRLDGKYADIKDALLHAYPALEKGGGFELMRTAGPYFYKFAFYTIRRKAVWLRRNV